MQESAGRTVVREGMNADDLIAAHKAIQAEQAKAKTAADAWRGFLESTPPNVSMKIDGLFEQHHPGLLGNSWSVPLPEIELFCEVDNGRRFFATKADYIFAKRQEWKYVSYLCKNCGRQWKTFYLLVSQPRIAVPSNAEVMKLAEYPSFSAPVSSQIQKFLGKSDLELYRKGMRAEEQGLGIGAATYFRRVVDHQWKHLVAEIREAAVKLGYTDLHVFDKAMKETQFSRAVDTLNDAIPPRLLILDRQNPLTLLSRPLSVQLHELTDEECLQEAADVRVVLAAFLENIVDVLKDEDELKGAATRLAARKK